MSTALLPVYIIIPVHNRKATTLKCLETLQVNGDLDRYHVVVVDDGSVDDTAVAIQTLYPDVHLLSGDGNLWWTGAIALGMKYAAEQGAEYLIWLNDDCVPDKSALSKLVEFLTSHPCTIAGAACYLHDSNYLIPTGAQGRKRINAQPGEVRPVDEMSGHCVGMPAQVINQIGLPNSQRFPHYHGDSMYVLKATRSGFPAYILGDVKLMHDGIVKSQISDFLAEFKPDQSAIADFQSLFFNKKSLYFLPTQFFYYFEKYGLFLGITLFFGKLIIWLTKFLKSLHVNDIEQ